MAGAVKHKSVQNVTHCTVREGHALRHQNVTHCTVREGHALRYQTFILSRRVQFPKRKSFYLKF